MASNIYSAFPPELNPEQERYLASTIKDWTIHNGLTVRPAPDLVPEEIRKMGVLATNAPVTVFPSPFPKHCFDEARAVQKRYNELYAAISSNEKWLGEIMEE